MGWYGLDVGQCAEVINSPHDFIAWFALKRPKAEGGEVLFFRPKDAIYSDSSNGLTRGCVNLNGGFEFFRTHLNELGKDCPDGHILMDTAFGYKGTVGGWPLKFTIDLTD